jgi:hypothetical protein
MQGLVETLDNGHHVIRDVPVDLAPGMYQTKVLGMKFSENGLKFELQFIGPYNEQDPCLIPLIKAAT